MCETSELPAVPLRAPNRHPSFYSQSQRVPRADAKLAVSRIRHNSTQSNKIQQNPTKIRVCTRAHAREATASRFLSAKPYPRGDNRNVRNIRTAGRAAPRPKPSPVILLPIAARPKSRCQTRGQQDSTQFDTIQQNPTKSDENSCVRTRARARGNGVPFPFSRHGLPPRRSGFDASLGAAAPSRHANRPNGTPSFQLVAYNSRVCYYFPRIGERRQT